MLPNARFWTVFVALAAAPAAYAARRIPLHTVTGQTRAGMAWRAMALLFALLNLKLLPGGWHMRMLRSLLTHLSLRRGQEPEAPGPAQLFQAVITSSRTTLLETDYNLHKSNSTYFSDLDVGRAHLVSCVFARGVHRAQFGPVPPPEPGSPDPNGRLAVMLGGVTCAFRRELKPYQPFEVWSRIIAWDRKWVYMVSHIVKAGAVRPVAYSMQPWKTPRRAVKGANGSANGSVNGAAKDAVSNGGVVQANGGAEPDGAIAAPAPHPAILATSIAKYVFKRGRWTLPPEIALENSGLLPPRPEAGPLSEEQRAALTDADGVLWDWDRVELERQRGMETAKHMANLDEVQFEFSGDNATVLGRW